MKRWLREVRERGSWPLTLAMWLVFGCLLVVVVRLVAAI